MLPNFASDKKASNTAFMLLLWVKVPVWQKKLFFQKTSDTRKIKGVLVLKAIYYETTYPCIYVPSFNFVAQFKQVLDREKGIGGEVVG